MEVGCEKSFTFSFFISKTTVALSSVYLFFISRALHYHIWLSSTVRWSANELPYCPILRMALRQLVRWIKVTRFRQWV